MSQFFRLLIGSLRGYQLGMSHEEILDVLKVGATSDCTRYVQACGKGNGTAVAEAP